MSVAYERVVFFCPGLPRAKGSTSSFIHPSTGRVVTKSGGSAKRQKNLASWDKAIAWEARKAWRHDPIEGPVSVRCLFFLPRPKSHFGTGKNASVLKSSAPRFPVQKPDGDKLERASWDALSRTIFSDDAQVVDWSGAKRWAEHDDSAGWGSGVPGVQITVETFA